MSDFETTPIDGPAGWVDVPMMSTDVSLRGGADGPLNAQAIALVRRMKFVRQVAEESKAAAEQAADDAGAVLSVAQDALNVAEAAEGVAGNASATASDALSAANSAGSLAATAKGIADAALPRVGGELTGAVTGPGFRATSDAVDPSDVPRLSQTKAMVRQAVFAGVIVPAARLTAPPGWLLIDGKTIGNASSGATSRANADTAELFACLWDFPAAAVPIYTNTGAASTRGVSAAADFAAGKRLPLFTPDGGAFIRMWAPSQTKDAGRVAGSAQVDAFQGHEHQFYDVTAGGGGGYNGAGANNWTRETQAIVTKSGFSAPRVADETRPYNLAVPHFIFLGVPT